MLDDWQSPLDGPVPRREDGAPARLWYGANFHTVRELFDLGLGGVVAFTARALPASNTGRSVHQPERMYAVGMYSWLTGEMIAEAEMRREHLAILRDAIDLALNQPLPPEDPQ